MSPPPEEAQGAVSKDVQSGAQARSRVAALLAWARGKINPREPGIAVSAGAHVALLAATLIAFAETKKFDDVAEAIPVEMMSDQQFSQIMGEVGSHRDPGRRLPELACTDSELLRPGERLPQR